MQVVCAAADPTLAEPLVVRWCLEVAIKRGIPQPVIVCDASIVVDCIHGKIKRVYLDPIIFDCRELLSKLTGAEIQHIRREANSDAHQLVGLSRSVGDQSWSNLVQLASLNSLCNISVICNDHIFS